MLWFKKLTMPNSNAVKSVVVLQLWEVRWVSRHGEYRADTKAEAEFFTSPTEANGFADALRAAFRLTRNTTKEETKVTVQTSVAH